MPKLSRFRLHSNITFLSNLLTSNIILRPFYFIALSFRMMKVSSRALISLVLRRLNFQCSRRSIGETPTTKISNWTMWSIISLWSTSSETMPSKILISTAVIFTLSFLSTLRQRLFWTISSWWCQIWLMTFATNLVSSSTRNWLLTFIPVKERLFGRKTPVRTWTS